VWHTRADRAANQTARLHVLHRKPGIERDDAGGRVVGGHEGRRDDPILAGRERTEVHDRRLQFVSGPECAVVGLIDRAGAVGVRERCPVEGVRVGILERGRERQRRRAALRARAVDALLEGPEADPLPAVLEAFAQPVQRHEILVGVRQLAGASHRRLAELEVGISRRHAAQLGSPAGVAQARQPRIRGVADQETAPTFTPPGAGRCSWLPRTRCTAPSSGLRCRPWNGDTTHVRCSRTSSGRPSGRSRVVRTRCSVSRATRSALRRLGVRRARSCRSRGFRMRSTGSRPTATGHTKFNRRCDRFLRRGRSACRSEWRLINATRSLLKLHKHTTAPLPA
jgi:hypothetical protein